MAWLEIGKSLLLLLVSIGIVTVVILMGTGKYQSTSEIDSQIGYVFGFSLMIVVVIFMTNHLFIQSQSKMKLYTDWGLIYSSLILSYVSMSYMNISSFGGSISSGAVNNVANSAPGSGSKSGSGPGAGPGSCGSCC
jgi:uncharacterized membrane protein